MVSALQPMVTVLGKEAAGLILVTVCDPRKYHSWHAFIKSAGLNPVESSSGIHKGQVHIRKRGNPEVRRLPYMSVLRIVQSPRVSSWYQAKKQ